MMMIMLEFLVILNASKKMKIKENIRFMCFHKKNKTRTLKRTRMRTRMTNAMIMIMIIIMSITMAMRTRV